MRLTQAEREAREMERQERVAARARARFKKLMNGADATFDNRGYVCLTFSDGQVFKCRGPLPESVYGSAPEVK